ncbi:helix-turn-helix domain-containing protein [Methylobacterium sp. Gmos1]
MARVVENITASLRAMVPEHAIRRLIQLEVRATVQALPSATTIPPARLQEPELSARQQGPERITYRVEEAAKLIGVSASKVWGLIGEGRLPARKLDDVRLIRRVDLEAFIDAMPVPRGSLNDG